MKTTFLHTILAFLLLIFSAGTLIASTSDNKQICPDGDCLLCYLSMAPNDPYIAALRDHYNMDSSTYLGLLTLTNKEEGISLSQLSKKIGKIEIDPSKFKGAIPLGVSASDNQASLEARFGADEDPFEWVYVKKLNNLFTLIAHLSDPDYNGVKKITYEMMDGYVGIDPEICFSKGIEEATTSENMSDDRDPVCLFMTDMIADIENEFLSYYEKAPEGFTDGGNYGTETGGFGWNSIKTFNSKSAADAELNRLVKAIKSCPTDCCMFITNEDTLQDPDRPNKIKTIKRTPILVRIAKYPDELLDLVIYLTLWHEDWGILDGYDPETIPQENDTYILQFGMETNPKK